MSSISGYRSAVYTAMTWRSHAKINLYLDVLKKRRDGYHNIETIFQTISLADDLTFMDDDHISLTCTGHQLDTGASNLITRAALLFQQYTGYSRGARIQLEKRIPVSAGLAGGSGNAAATLIALNKLWDTRLTTPQLAALARNLGADVPYCLYGGTQAAWLRGDCMTALPDIKGYWFVLVHPPIAVSAGQVYQHPGLQHNKERPFAGRTASFRRRIRALARDNMADVVFNRMEMPVFTANKMLAAHKVALLNLGCEAAAMSGSGPTLFGVCRSQQQALRIAEGLKGEGVSCPHSVAAATPTGVERIA